MKAPDTGTADASGFRVVARAAEIPNGGCLACEVDGQPIAIFNINRTFHAVRNRCTHLDYRLDDGRVLGCAVICRKHGARFDLASGRALDGPAVLPLHVFQVRVADGSIEVRLD